MSLDTGAIPYVSRSRRLFGSVVRAFSHPLTTDDYLATVNPTWSRRELMGVVVNIVAETRDASTVVIKPTAPWPAHVAGQYVRLGLEIDGVRHWRAYTLTSDPEHVEGLVSVTVKHVAEGVVSPWIIDQLHRGDVVFLGEAEGTFVLPDITPAKVLLVSGGSGVTPIWSLLRALARHAERVDVVHIHMCHDEQDFIFGRTLMAAAERNPHYVLIPHYRSTSSRLRPQDLDELVPDWNDRTTFLSGPGAMMDDFAAYWEQFGSPDLLHLERFQPHVGGFDAVEPGSGGSIHFRVTQLDAESDGRTSILEAGEAAGGALPHGCRMGVCHTCKCRLVHGQVRDLRTGAIHGLPGEMIRTCINAPEGHIELDEGHVVMPGTNPRSPR